MKFSGVIVALGAVVAGAVMAEAAPTEHKSVPWSEIEHRHAKHWDLYNEPHGVDLTKSKPFFAKCKVPHQLLANRKSALHTFRNNPSWEFYQLSENHILANCINCSPQLMANYYLTKLAAYIDCDAFNRQDA